MTVATQAPRDFAYTFPAIRGFQAGREYYVAMCRLRIVPKLFRLDDDAVPPELKAQRALNRTRIPQLVRYLVENTDNYVFSSLAASVDGELAFEPFGLEGASRKLGMLHVPMDARFLINDGQHRLAAIISALRVAPSIANDTISVVLFADAGLARSQQMFADLNRYAVRPPKSLGILYDHRDPMARLVWHLIDTVPVFKGMTETARSTISNRSRKLFTLSSIYQATRKLLGKRDRELVGPEEEAVAQQFWIAVARNVPEWAAAVNREVNPSDLRSTYVHSHGVALQAIATAGQALLSSEPKGWRRRLEKLKDIDWSRQNVRLWEGRALIGGRLSKAEQNVVLTANVVKAALGLPLTEGEQKVEDLHEASRDRRTRTGQQNDADQRKSKRTNGINSKALPR